MTRPRRVRVLCAAGATALALSPAGCRRSGPDLPEARVVLLIDPERPRVGPATVTAQLNAPGGEPLAGADVRIEGNMSHAGMKPVFAPAREAEPGRYRASLEFTMAGDWIVTVTATWPDGRRIERQIPVPGVRP